MAAANSADMQAAAVQGIAMPDDVRNGLIAMRVKAMSEWPSRISDTIILSHAIYWMSRLANLDGSGLEERDGKGH